MSHKWVVLRWALLTSVLSTLLAVLVNFAAGLESSWLGWIGVLVITILSAVVSVTAQKALAGRAASRARVPNHHQTTNTVSGDSSGPVVQAGTIESVFQPGAITGGVHIHQVALRTFIAELSVVILATVAAIAILRTERQVSPAASVDTPPNPPASVTTPAAINGPLAVTSDWPDVKGCDPFTPVAMPLGGPAATTFPAGAADVRQQMTAAGGAAWLGGVVYLHLSTTQATAPMEILNIVPRIDPPSHASPAWIYAPQSEGCGPDYNERIFKFDLDKPSLDDQGASIDAPSDPSARLVRKEPLGPTFQVSAGNPSTIRVDVQSCTSNYTWYLELHYKVSGEEHEYVRPVGPFRAFGMAAGTTPVYSKTSANGSTYQFMQSGTTATLPRNTCA